jgi:UDP-4-amino-4,6-dideoxy-N-acetyl-beta-L-altrosamine transaminase
MSNNIPYSTQSVDKSDIKAVVKTLKSNFLTQGPSTLKFEKQISKLTKSKYAISANSATSGLHLVCLALGLSKKDLVWVSSISFVASANCAAYCGSKIDFVDIDSDTFNICAKSLEQKLIIAKKNKKLPNVLIVVHLGGLSSDMKKIFKLSKKFGFVIIEDASHALGSTYYNLPVGSCKYSIASIFSFHPVKIATSAEGGIVTTNSKLMNEKIRMFREHGIERTKKNFINKKEKFKLYYEQQKLGYNFRLSEVHASLGLSQIRRIKYFAKRRNSIRINYIKKLSGLPIKFQKIPNYCNSSFHLMIVRVHKNLRNKLYIFLKKRNISTNVHYLPIFMHPYYFNKRHLINKNSIDYYNEALSIPLYVDLKEKEQNKVIKSIYKFFKNLSN